MKNYIFAILILLAVIGITGCTSHDTSKDNSEYKSGENTEGDRPEGTADPSSGDSFVLKAVVTSVSESGRLEVEVIESDYAFGIYWVLINSDTAFYSADGSAVSRDSLNVGDTVFITYGGQVMMSYPPQIVALKIQKSN